MARLSGAGAAPIALCRRWGWLLAAALTLASSADASPLLAALVRRQSGQGDLRSSVDFLPNDTLPSYALQYAPYVYLHSQERYFPADPYLFLNYVAPYTNFTPVDDAPSPLNASTIDDLSSQDDVYLTAQPYLSALQIPMPSWLEGQGAPDSNGRTAAPALILAIDKSGVVGPGWVDVFYMFFYAWNQGVAFYGNVFGNHVGDWEQTMIRFANGTPMYVVPEAHGASAALGSEAYTFDAVEKRDGRPVVYSANGTHGVSRPAALIMQQTKLTTQQMYPIPGTINYTGVPQIPLYDYTDKGYLWDPTLNARRFFYSGDGGFYPTNDSTNATDRVTGWLDFAGAWGDQQYNYSVINQTCVGDECFYSSGPQGPRSKSISRGWICVSDCTPQTVLPTVLPALSSSSQSAENAAAGLAAPITALATAILVGLSVLVL